MRVMVKTLRMMMPTTVTRAMSARRAVRPAVPGSNSIGLSAKATPLRLATSRRKDRSEKGKKRESQWNREKDDRAPKLDVARSVEPRI
jgi:hypothetical protein